MYGDPEEMEGSLGNPESNRSPIDAALLRAIIDRIVPADCHPSASGFGADHFILAALATDAVALAPAIQAGLDTVAAVAIARYGCDFVRLDAACQDKLLEDIETCGWFTALCELTAEGVYADPANGGNRNAAAWAMIGYRHGLPDGPAGPQSQTVARSSAARTTMPDFDAIVVGAGAGGGVAACILAEAGKRVLLIERGLPRTYGDSGHRDHLRNHRLALYGHNTGPALEGHPRVFVAPDGTERIVRPHEIVYGNNAACVGSGTFLYGGLAWRFHPDDFRMASRYGVPEGSSLCDWPFDYAEMEPWYSRAEDEIGVSGDPLGCPHEPFRSAPYPMPPVPATMATMRLAAGAVHLGMDSVSPPLLINTVARDGRAACIRCGSCVGFPCPSNGKNGTQNTVIPRALATGNCTLWNGVTVTGLSTDPRGVITGVTCASEDQDGRILHRQVRARAVVLSAGAIETARLLLASATTQEPNGIGNRNGMVGRNLQAHLYPTAFGLFDDIVHDSLGPGVTIASTAFCHGNPGIIGGAMLADDFTMLPIIFWRHGLPPTMKRWGAAPKAFMRESFQHVLQVKGPVHEVPSPESRVTLARSVKDRFGTPVARLSGMVHEETMRTIGFIYEREHAWLRAAGAKETWHQPIVRRLSSGQHQAGTCRMGRDPASSVTDPYGRVWGHANLFVCDASLHPTNGAFNPVLTILALAFRNATRIAASI
jgi:choline dehydrogenase-like flavoprotein